MLTYYRPDGDIEKLTLPILPVGSLFPFWIPTGDLVCQFKLEATSTSDSLSVVCFSFLSIQRSGVPARRRVSGPRAPLARSTRANTARDRPLTLEGCLIDKLAYQKEHLTMS